VGADETSDSQKDGFIKLKSTSAAVSGIIWHSNDNRIGAVIVMWSYLRNEL
jgi:hypothetical protein